MSVRTAGDNSFPGNVEPLVFDDPSTRIRSQVEPSHSVIRHNPHHVPLVFGDTEGAETRWVVGNAEPPAISPYDIMGPYRGSPIVDKSSEKLAASVDTFATLRKHRGVRIAQAAGKLGNPGEPLPSPKLRRAISSPDLHGWAGLLYESYVTRSEGHMGLGLEQPVRWYASHVGGARDHLRTTWGPVSPRVLSIHRTTRSLGTNLFAVVLQPSLQKQS